MLCGSILHPGNFWCKTAFSWIWGERTFSADGRLLVQDGLLVQGRVMLRFCLKTSSLWAPSPSGTRKPWRDDIGDAPAGSYHYG
jgi:hypothetical protein